MFSLAEGLPMHTIKSKEFEVKAVLLHLTDNIFAISLNDALRAKVFYYVIL